MTHRRIRWAIAFVLPLTVSCNLLTPLIFVGEHKKKISPEFDRLANSRVVILAWTDPATLFDYPHARFELASYVGEKLSAEMAQRSLATEVVDARDVEDYLQRTLDAQIDPQAVGREFDADYVVYIEVYEFQIRDPDIPQFLQGRIDASVSVHDIHADPGTPRRYELTEVKCLHPEGGPVTFSPTNAPVIRRSTYRKFAEQVARKFYEHTVDL